MKTRGATADGLLRKAMFVTVAAICLSALVSAFFLGGCGSAQVTGTSAPPPGTAASSDTSTLTTVYPTTTSPSSATTTVASPGAEDSVVVYFVRGEKLAATRRPMSSYGPAEAVMRGLLAGPDPLEREIGFGTTIPDSTRLRSVSQQGGVIKVDLSRDFGSGGGSLSMLLRVAQVVYSLTEIPGVERVEFLLDGVPAEAIGGEGVIVEGGVARDDFSEFLPEVLLFEPYPGQAVKDSVAVHGNAGEEVGSLVVLLAGRDGVIISQKEVQWGQIARGRRSFQAALTVSGPPTRGALILTWSAGLGEQRSFEIPIEIVE